MAGTVGERQACHDHRIQHRVHRRSLRAGHLTRSRSFCDDCPSARFGALPAFAFNLGVIMGDIVLMLLAVFGLAVVAQTLGGWFVLVKIAGGL